MANSLLTSSIITREVAMVLAEKLTFLRRVNRQYDDQYARTGAKIGDTLKIRLPSRGTVRTGRVANLQDLVDRTVDLTIANQYGIDLGATSADMALSIDDFRDRYIEPKVADLASTIEGHVLEQNAYKVPNVAGDYGPLDDWSTVLEAGKKLSDNLVPRSDRTMLVGNTAEMQALDAFKAFFNHQGEIGKQYREGQMGRAGGFDWFSSSLMPTYTRGTANAGYLVNGAGQTGSTLAVDTGTGTLAQGDVFTIAGVFAVHPQTKESLGYLQEFTVTSAYAGGAGSVSISPALTATGPEQNVSNAPADNAAITVKGVASTAYQNNIAFAKDAFAFVTADLPLPPKMDASRVTYQGISLRYINGYDITNDMFVSRIDILWGAELIRPEMAVRIPTTL